MAQIDRFDVTTLVQTQRTLDAVSAVAEVFSRTHEDREWHEAWDNLATAVISGNQAANVLVVTVLNENGLSAMKLKAFMTDTEFKAFSRSIAPIMKTMWGTPNIEEQKKFITLARDPIYTETR